jgi:tetrahydromethanopterin S-methyltransferase subunit D
VNNDAIYVRVGAPLGGIGFVLLFVEAARVVFGKQTLHGIDGILPWVGLGLLIVGAVLLALAIGGSAEPRDSVDGQPRTG